MYLIDANNADSNYAETANVANLYFVRKPQHRVISNVKEWVVLNQNNLEQYLMNKPKVTTKYVDKMKTMKFLINNKVFCMLGMDKDGRPIVTMKCEPDVNSSLREQYPEIVGGYFMNKDHWNSIPLQSSVPEETVKNMIDISYKLVGGK